MKKIFVVFSVSCLMSFELLASQINLEVGRIKTSHNRFQLPNEKVNEVQLPEGEYSTSYRLRGTFDLKGDKFLSFLYAPFQGDYKFRSDNSFKFDNSNFAANADTKVDYKFNSYRVGYFQRFSPKKDFKYWLGGVLKVRDAKIKVTQGDLRDSYSNVGLVPLIGIGAEYFLQDDISLFSHIETLGFDKGYAYDFNAEMRYYLNQKNAIGFGYRTFGGGVDNDKLMNSARFESFYVNYSKGF